MAINVKKHLNIPITIQAFKERDRYSEIVYEDPVDTTCYVEDKIEIIKNNSGVEVVSQTVMYIAGEDKVNEQSLIHFEGKDYTAKAVKAVRDKSGLVVLWMVYV